MTHARRHGLSLTLLILIACLGASCSRSAGAEEEEHDRAGHAEHEEGEDGAMYATMDPHHVAEDRSDCEDDVTLPQEALERYGIVVEPVREVALKPTMSAPGHLAFPQGAVARVGSPVAGRVAEIRVRSGDTVAQGDALFVIESPDLGEAQSGYLQKRMVTATAGPTLDLARDAFERGKELYERVQGIALSDLQRREAELRALERDLEVARAAEAAAHDRLVLLGMSAPGIRALEEGGRVDPRLVVGAPIGGRIVEISATLGELIGPDKDRLVVVGDLSTLWAIAEVSESRLAEVVVGAPATVRVPALGLPSREGRVAATATVLEASTRTAEVRVELPNHDGTMLPGMFIQVDIESSRGAGPPVLAVPDAAVLTVEGRPSVFVPLEPGSTTFCKHEVEIGAPVGTHIPVLSGLEAGELVVVSGTFRLKAEHGKAAAEHEH